MSVSPKVRGGVKESDLAFAGQARKTAAGGHAAASSAHIPAPAYFAACAKKRAGKALDSGEREAIAFEERRVRELANRIGNGQKYTPEERARRKENSRKHYEANKDAIADKKRRARAAAMRARAAFEKMDGAEA